EIETPLNTLGRRQAHPYLLTYSEQIVSLIRERTGMTEPLKGTHIIVDAGNGAGGFFVEKVLDVLGADTTGSQFLEPDGLFPNHAPNPEDPEAIASVCKAVVDSGADMGIIFDTDVDRSAIIDETGKPINRNAFIAFMAKMILSQNPGTTIVTDSITSTGLTKYIEDLGGTHHRFKRGYKNVINEAIRLNAEGQETHLAMETSGHGAIKENYFLDDGAYLATMALIEYTKLHAEGKKLSEYLIDLQEPAEAVEVRYVIDAEDFKSYGADVLKDFSDFAVQQPGWEVVSPNYEGVRVACDEEHGNGWCLLRMSLHEPKMPLNIESDSEGGCALIKSVIDRFTEAHPELKA
ncbi:MAG: phosphomannomutase/phosphoglucomutase, partial [Eubacteriaceae bacterium]|nr:phosphomannomutase/phosphoglucomutase [Eubacteriaceae bacterium]